MKRDYGRVWLHGEGGLDYMVKAGTVEHQGRSSFLLKLVYSRFGKWYEHIMGKVAARLVDHGNGVVITLGGKDKRREIVLDYGETAEIYYLLRELSKRTDFGMAKRLKIKEKP